MIVSCDSNAIGGGCRYDNVPGTARITALVTVATGVEAHFDFTPTDPNATPKYGSDTNQILRTGSGQLPSADLLASNGIVVGRIIPAVREEETKGTCTPMIYAFSTLSGLYGD